MKLSQLLVKQAEQILSQSEEYVAINLLKKAGMDERTARTQVAQVQMEKAAAMEMAATGIDYDAALNLVKVAGIKIETLKEFKAEPSPEEILADSLMKAAAIAEDLESKVEEVEMLHEKVAELEEVIRDIPEVQSIPEPITKFASSGTFSNEDLNAMMSLPEDTLKKIASFQDKPWAMGKSSSAADSSSLDPLAEFCLS